jgi:hypothetical protein
MKNKALPIFGDTPITGNIFFRFNGTRQRNSKRQTGFNNDLQCACRWQAGKYYSGYTQGSNSEVV